MHTITKTIANTGTTSSSMVKGAVIGTNPQCCRRASGEFDCPRIPHELVVDSAPLLPMPTSHSAVRKMSARARHEDADQCRVSNWRAFSNRLSECPGSDRKRTISAMQ
jgi:hypothetical protein